MLHLRQSLILHPAELIGTIASLIGVLLARIRRPGASAYRRNTYRLLGTLPHLLIGSRASRRGRARDMQFVSGNVERYFSIDPVPIRERTAFNVVSNSPVCLVHRVGAEIGYA